MRSSLLLSLCWSVSTQAFLSVTPEQKGAGLSVSSTTSKIEETTFAVSPIETIQDPVILFDGVCNFCNTWVDLLLRIDRKEKFRFAPLQSTIGQSLLLQIGKEADDISSVVLVVPTEPLTFHDKSDCVLQVVQELGWPAQFAARGAEALLPIEVRDGIYDVVAENRYSFLGKRDECRCGDPKYADRFLA